jgi:hypothetical protein
MAPQLVLASTAAGLVGQEVWHESTQHAESAAVLKVLQMAHSCEGLQISQLSIRALDSALTQQGWTAHATPQPGDVVIGYYGGGIHRGGNAGIVGQDLRTVYVNSSSTHRWSAVPISSFVNNHDMQTVRFLRAPLS